MRSDFPLAFKQISSHSWVREALEGEDFSRSLFNAAIIVVHDQVVSASQPGFFWQRRLSSRTSRRPRSLRLCAFPLRVLFEIGLVFLLFVPLLLFASKWPHVENLIHSKVLAVRNVSFALTIAHELCALRKFGSVLSQMGTRVGSIRPSPRCVPIVCLISPTTWSS